MLVVEEQTTGMRFVKATGVGVGVGVGEGGHDSIQAPKVRILYGGLAAPSRTMFLGHVDKGRLLQTPSG